MLVSLAAPTDSRSGGGETEIEIRRRLGIPEWAERVLVLTETSHWDPDWLLTSEGYFTLRVRRNLTQAIEALLADPRRIYSVECVFFLRMFHERVPEHRAHVRDLVNSGRLRMMGSGVTTPYTIIPSAELLIRDYLVGQEWLRTHGMDQEPEVAYFPDTFGFSPGLPEVLASVGVSRAAICRIDGMYFFGNETEPASRFPRPSSSAEHLLEHERTLDFVWRGPDGAEVLTHWLAFTYGQGELLAHLGITRQAGAPLAVPWATDRHVRSRIDRYVAQLAPVARTPYLLCPIGFDFSAPIRGLVDLIERYDDRHAAATGTWVVNAGLDDYLALVDHHRDVLPTLELDASQYYTGFFTSRPTLKRRYAELGRTLLLAERLSLSPAVPHGRADEARRDLAESWWTMTTANHHDFVTGTAPDRVVRREQLPWLDAAFDASRRVLDRLASTTEPGPEPARRMPRRGSTRWTRIGSRVEITTSAFQLVFDESRGGALVAATTTDGRHLIGAGPSLDIVAWLDTGGLWRMGHEYRGGRFELVDQLSRRSVEVSLREDDDGTIELRSAGVLDGHPVVRVIRIDPTDPVIRVSLETTLADRRCATLRVGLPAPVSHLVTDVPGGVVTRPTEAIFDPAFWPAQSFAVLPGADDRSIAILTELPGAVAVRNEVADVIVSRNANKELAYGALPLPAQPARGHDPGPHSLALAVAFDLQADWRAAGLPAAAASERRTTWASDDLARLEARAEAVLTTDRVDVVVSAAKLADRGPGAVVRLTSTAIGPVETTLRWPGVDLVAACWCDGRERDRGAIATVGDQLTLTVPPGISSVRLVRS